MNLNPLGFADLVAAFKSAFNLAIIKKHVYIPLAAVLAIIAFAISNMYSIVFLAPIFAVVLPFLVMTVAVFMDNNKPFSLRAIGEGLLLISMGFLPVLVVLTFIFFAIVFYPQAFTAVLCGIASTIGPGDFLCDGDAGVWDTARVTRAAFSGCIVLSMFIIVFFSTLEIAYLRLRHGIKRNDAVDKYIRQQAIANVLVESVITLPLFFSYIFLLIIPALGVVALIHSFTYLYFVYKAKYDGNPNTSAEHSTAKNTVQKTA